MITSEVLYLSEGGLSRNIFRAVGEIAVICLAVAASVIPHLILFFGHGYVRLCLAYYFHVPRFAALPILIVFFIASAPIFASLGAMMLLRLNFFLRGEEGRLKGLF